MEEAKASRLCCNGTAGKCLQIPCSCGVTARNCILVADLLGVLFLVVSLIILGGVISRNLPLVPISNPLFN